MKTEFEAKFVNVDHDDIRSRLNDIGAKLERPMQDMRRVTIDTPEMKRKNAYVRIRDEGNKIVATYKQFDDLSIDGAKEIEIQVNDFDETIKLFESAGLPYYSYQESRRETWTFGSTEIVLDEWPWLNPYIEIESKNEELVHDCANKLKLSWAEAIFGDVMAAYRVQYPWLKDSDTVGNLKLVRFDDPLPEMFKQNS